MKNNKLEFLRSRNFLDMGPIGRGGLGEARLILDDIINEHFVCKKYSPSYEEHKEKYFRNFIDEIKLLHLAFHKNIVRVFNYYLYPDQYVGYIVMEYVEGQTIDEYCMENPEKVSLIFEQVIEGFRHLEEIQVLHRDIRPANILVAKSGVVKIIDFGFGKRIELPREGFTNSVLSINWRYSVPDEFQNGVYDFSTDAYFIGRMFEQLISENNITNFKYEAILKQMTADYAVRMGSFSEISRAILTNDYGDIGFSQKDRKVYLSFANSLSVCIASLSDNPQYIKDPDQVLAGLQKIYQESMLENSVQNINKVINCFIVDSYKFYPKKEFKVECLKNFVEFFKGLTNVKRKITLNNLWNRFDTFERITDFEDDLPF